MSRDTTQPPSLMRRMTFGIVAFHSVGILLLLLAQPLHDAGPGSLRAWFAMEQARKLLTESLDRDASGVLVFRPTAGMAAYIQVTPEFWFVAADDTASLRGGSAAPPARLLPDGNGTPADRAGLPMGVAVDIWTEGRRVGALIGGQRGSLSAGIWAWITDWLGNWLLVVGAISIGTSLVSWLLVRFLLRPVRAAAEAARQLVPGRHQASLPLEGVPAEILPLVTATNAAFARVEKEHERQRRFIASAAHELRTPIAILSLRLDELPDGAVKQRLQLDVSRLRMLANQLLDLERMRHARALPGAEAVEPVEMVALTRDVAAEMAPLALATGSDIAFHTAIPRWDLPGDENSLRSVLLNLVGNALTHGGAGVLVEVRIEAGGLLSVSDNGPGIPPEARDRIFEAFQRAGTSRDGTGLGLYIVREVLRFHGATIELLNDRSANVFRLQFP